MKFNLKKEIPLLLMLLLPFVYLLFVWADLPNEVPIHYNIEGEADNYATKTVFALILLAMSLFTYVLMQVLPFIDPKDKVKQMGNKFYKIKFITLGFIAVLSVFLIYKTVYPDFPIQFLMVLLGAFFIILGNYFQTIKPNYFLGLRTPWTLQNDVVWEKTHRLTGKIYMLGGLLIVISYFVFSHYVSAIIMIVLMILMAIFPVIYSFILFRNEKAKSIV